MIAIESMYPGDDLSTPGVKLLSVVQTVGATTESDNAVPANDAVSVVDAGLPVDASLPDAYPTILPDTEDAGAAAEAMVTNATAMVTAAMATTAAATSASTKKSNIPMIVFVSLLGAAGLAIVIAAARSH